MEISARNVLKRQDRKCYQGRRHSAATKAEPARSLISQGFPRCPLRPTALSSLRLGAA
jgi:hypothetical protein